MRRIVIRPVLFRPPDFVKPSVRVLTGRPFQSSERSISTSPRWPGVVGLYDLSAMLSVFRYRCSTLRAAIDRAPKVPEMIGPEGPQLKTTTLRTDSER